MLRKWKQAVVVGSSQGIGEALVYELARHDISVALVSRNDAAMKAVAEKAKTLGQAKYFPTYHHDVTNYAEVPELFQQITKDIGGLDVIIYNAGVMPDVKLDEYNFEKDKHIIEVNLLGAMAWLDEAAKRFTSVEEGTIVGISSIAGERGRIVNPPYHTSKAAIATYLESLRNRLSRRGVNVVTIKPGLIETEMGKKSPNRLWMITPEEAARQIVKAARRGAVVKYVPWKWRIMSFVLHSIPSFIFRRLSF
ncbi:MAG TPA: SDR family NAD(P)-dependent oxidoreductase [Candidatus Kapabacteria bacterium]|nr:SDR family NAD(P)-dependent oxidoreductase [Candidatus Kapabacteria bacterium]